ncbi:MAG: von Willebrand factor type A domain-containing protein [Planctomycetes bacterium]|nr:von Willebrand factor type A domain-containing protein [Planctomycetota bacterium]
MVRSARALPVLLVAGLLLHGCGRHAAAPVTTEPPPPASAPETSAVDNVVPEGTSKESAFDSNQWNSAVGLGGGAGGRFGGRRVGTESYASTAEGGFFAALDRSLSTFAADVDTASFTNVRRMLRDGALPPPDAVRIEEFVNAQRYGAAAPGPREAFTVAAEVGRCAWNADHELVRLSIRTRPIEADKVPPCNLVFLVDVSGSMDTPQKLPLLQQALGLLIDQLRPQDHVAIVTYAAGVEVPLASARGDERERIREAVQALRGCGSTNGQGGIQRAYEIARAHRTAGVNRVLLATDGDFNVGIRSPDELEAFIAAQKQDDIFLTVLGLGSGNLKDDRLERLADKGNGVYVYLDDLAAARRVLVEQFGASMMTVAKDVKLQVEFDPRQVQSYRLLGYDNRALAAQDFRDDQKDGGELGAGHCVTALYEIVRRADAPRTADATLLTLRIRYKPPEGDTSREFAHRVAAPAAVPEQPSDDFQVAATAAALALQLRGSKDCGNLCFDLVAAMAGRLPPPGSDDLRSMVSQACALASRAGVEAR